MTPNPINDPSTNFKKAAKMFIPSAFMDFLNFSDSGSTSISILSLLQTVKKSYFKLYFRILSVNSP